MNSGRIALVSLAVAWALSAAYIVDVGVDWPFTLRSGTAPSAIFTGAVLSLWAGVPYVILLPGARRGAQPLITVLAVLVILSFGLFALERGRLAPGDAGGSFIVVPFQQVVIAAAIALAGWFRRRVR